jgi:predicted porin
MKKLLLCGTAIAGLALVAAPTAANAEVNLDLGGYFKGYVGFASQDDGAGELAEDTREFEWKRETELEFSGETTLDNGLTVGFNTQLNVGDTNSTVSNLIGSNQFDEAYAYFQGGWGRVNAGAEDGAAYLLQVAAPSADSNIDGLRNRFLFVNPARDFDGNSTLATDEINFARADYQQAAFRYADKISYFTPKVNGFQAGVSYSPEVEEKPVDDRFSGMSGDETTGDFEHLFEVAARYDGEFEGVGLNLGAGYTTASVEDEGTGTRATGQADDDLQSFNIGAKATFAGFGFGGAYFDTNNGREDDADDQVWIIGADYTQGAYKLGLSYLDSEAERGASLDEDELQRVSAGAQYTYGPGMSFRGSVNWYEFDADNSLTNDLENDAVTVLLGTDISF